ncbi:MAG: glycoside hydrolase family 3 C-terminal domain-containing protein [Oscillospiraceae bacterium]|nr:glycoside hydrolase family 3 C-terminal domain-containing protein [Oscillospiraceae bacterium]
MAQKNYSEILGQMTLEEKASLCSGLDTWQTKPIPRLGIPSVWMSDGPNGLRKEMQTGGTNIMQKSEIATCFPTSVTTASSWDPELMEEIADAMADECKAHKVTTILGPGVNIKRSPLCGRNFEYFSEDPFLAGRMGAAFVRGFQKNGVGVSLKHFCANNQEHIRMSIDSVVDERALREIYLSPFEYIVKTEQPTTVMCSYNRLGGVYLSDNKRMLTDILRGEWGYKGIVVSDWGAVNDRVEGIRAGLDLEMPGNKGMNDRHIVAAVKNGQLSEEELDKVVLRMIKFAFECKENEGKGYKPDLEAHHQIARKAAEQSAVLLKNTDEALPLNKLQRVAVIGALADHLRYQGAGSSHINPYKTVSFTEAMRHAGQSFAYAPGYSLKGDGYSKKLIDEACSIAKGKDAVLVFIGLTDDFESEGFDRKHINMPKSHNILVEELAKVNDNIIVVLSCGSPVKIDAWECKVKSILNLYLGGQAGGEAAYNIIYGKVNPSGKLAETFPFNNEDNVVAKYFPMGPRTVEYRESIFVGYRFFDKAKKAVQYPFGHGLSYTKFEYSDAVLSKEKITEGETVTVTFKLKNIGKVAGAETAQIYVCPPESKIFKADRELKGFRKVFLQPGEEKEVSIELDERAFSFYNVNIGDWHAESGTYKIIVAASSRDSRLYCALDLTTAKPDAEIPDYRKTAPIYYAVDSMATIPERQFEAVLGRPLPTNSTFRKGELTINNSLSQVKVSAFGKTLYGLLCGGAKIVSLGAENPAMITESIKDMPLRSFSGFTGGLISQKSVDGLLDLCNGTRGGLKKLITGFKKEK